MWSHDASRLSLRCLLAALLLAGCRQDMRDQAKYEPLEPSDFFEDGRSARPLVPGTVPRGSAQLSRAAAPSPVTRAMLQRGRERFDIHCAVCHGRTGDGRGMVVLRGFPQPPSLHSDPVRARTPEHVFDVITRGFGLMPDYAEQISIEDRWAIVTYLQALQLSQHATMNDTPEQERRRLLREP